MTDAYSAELDAIATRYALPPEGREAVASLLDEVLLQSGGGGSPSTFGSWSNAVGTPGVGQPWALAAAPVEKRLGRYEVLGLLGEGGMGVVYRVRDPSLQRTMALKVIRPELMGRPNTVARFVEEAQITAQLQHPGVVSVHEIGHLADGRMYFTMMEVAGRTLRSVIRELHMLGGRPDSNSEWNLRRLIDAFRKVCEAVAYAHARGVLHRDLKPSNVMLGDFGEVLVLDWGLAGLRAGQGEEPLHINRGGRNATLDGSTPGTPRYMSPEQAAGQQSRVGPRSDVYALGIMLYEILVGRPPHADEHTEPSQAGGAMGVPSELNQVCVRATEAEPERRFPDASALAAEVGAWLEGARREEQALAMVAEADALLPEIADLRARAAHSREEAAARLARVRRLDGVDRKRPVWALEDAAARLEEEATLRELDWSQRLHAALNLAPELDAAHERLAGHYRGALVEAEARRDRPAAAQLARLFQTHDRGRHAGWLRGEAALTLITDPPQAEVSLFQYEAADRRMVEVFRRTLGRTPLIEVPLSIGSYLLILRAPGRAEVRYPVWLGRGDHWSGAPRGMNRPEPVPLPPALGAGEAYVPAGWTRCGAPTASPGEEPPGHRWIDGFILGRVPVTNAEYLEFLNTLFEEGREEEALDAVPRERTVSEERGAMVYGRDADGRFELRPDFQGDLWEPDWPVVMVDWHHANRYAAWKSQRDGLPWRLPTRAEWQKAARGVDGRIYPWGDHFDPTFCCVRESFTGRGRLVPVGSIPADESPYGARDMAGNARTWCQDAPAGQGGDQVHLRNYCGGNWNGLPISCRSFHRSSGGLELLSPTTGIRLARSWP